jgi:P27 family predicted phage terminase small subunit
MSNSPGQGRKPNASTIIDNLRGRNEGNKIPSCPAWLSPEAKKIWRREAPELHKAGLLTFVDGPAFANYCLIRAQLKQAYEECGDTLTCEYTNKNGSTNEIAKPQIAIIHKCLDQLKSYSVEFGMTPASRTRIPAIDVDSKAKGNTLTERIMSGDPRKVLES